MNDYPIRNRVFLGLGLLLGGILLLAIVYTGLTEEQFNNSYALLADAFLNGRLHVDRCFDGDCAIYNGRTYVMFPPLPAVISMPFVALFGVGFKGFVFLGLVISAGSMLLWRAIFKRLMPGQGRMMLWLLLAIAFSSPLYYVTIRSNGVWFMAQTVAFFFVSLAIWLVVARRSLWLVGLAIGLAFLCRQFSIFYLPFLYVLTLDPAEPLFRIDWQRIRNGLKMALPALACVGIYMAYNYARFGTPGSTGYEFMDFSDGSILAARLREGSLFSADFGIFNFFYLFLQGFHAEFSGEDALTLSGIDSFGTGILAASPFILFALFAPNRRDIWVGAATIVFMIVPMLFYHSNGFTQYNTQRYTLDWLPIVFLILAATLPRGRFETFPVFVGIGMTLNLVTLGLLAITI